MRGQHVLPELRVAVNFGLCTAHANMAFIDPQRLWAPRPRIFECVGRVKGWFCARLPLLGWLVVDSVELNLIPLL